MLKYPRRLLGTALAALGLTSSHAVGQGEGELRAAWRQRQAEINQALASAPPYYVLTAGDSHAEGLGRAPLACAAVISAGIGGIDVQNYAEMADSLSPRARPAAIVLTIGTNNLLVRNKASSVPARLAFNREAIRLVSRLGSLTDNLIVTAIPPFAARVASKLDEGALVLYTRELKAACDSHPTCTFSDPYAHLRSDRFAIARDDALADALHLRDHAAVWRTLGRQVCSPQ